jgi:UDP-glucose 4-epimerase
MKRILVTGATGFLGKWMLQALKRDHPNIQIVSLSRQQNKPLGADQNICADLSKWDASLSNHDIHILKDMKFEAILHLAGLYNLRVNLEDAFLHNVYGTHNALRLAEIGQIPMFVQISTIAVTMGLGISRAEDQDPYDHKTRKTIEPSIRRPEFHETSPAKRIHRPIAADQETRGPFPDHYATTKAEAEKLVRNWSGEFPYRRLILRPGILIGDSKDGKISRIDGPYHAIDAFKRMSRILHSWSGALILPGHAERRIPLVPVDFAAQAISKFITAFYQSDETSKSYYVAPINGPTARELYQSALRHLDLNNEVRVTQGLPDMLVKPAAEWLARLPREELEYVLNLPELDYEISENQLGVHFYPPFETYESVIWRGYDDHTQNR